MADRQLAKGYRYAGVHCGVKSSPDNRDVALIVSDTPASGAGVFTQNRVQAAPRSRLPESFALTRPPRHRCLLGKRQRLHR